MALFDSSRSGVGKRVRADQAVARDRMRQAAHESSRITEGVSWSASTAAILLATRQSGVHLLHDLHVSFGEVFVRNKEDESANHEFATRHTQLYEMA